MGIKYLFVRDIIFSICIATTTEFRKGWKVEFLFCTTIFFIGGRNREEKKKNKPSFSVGIRSKKWALHFFILYFA